MTIDPSANDIRFMERGLELAAAAAAVGQTPFGALVVDGDGAILGEGHNTARADHDPTAHGEVVAIRAALRRLDALTLPPGCTLYTSCEPCLLCTFVIVQVGGIDRVVFAARGTDVPGWAPFLDADFAGAAPWIAANRRPIEVVGDVLGERARRMLAAFPW